MRAFNHAGPGQSDAYVVSKFARQIAEAEAAGRAGEPVEIVTGNLHVRRDFTDVRDVVRAYWLALERADPGVYNVCSGRSTEIGEILAGLARLAGVEFEQTTDPALLREHEVEGDPRLPREAHGGNRLGAGDPARAHARRHDSSGGASRPSRRRRLADAAPRFMTRSTARSYNFAP